MDMVIHVHLINRIKAWGLFYTVMFKCVDTTFVYVHWLTVLFSMEQEMDFKARFAEQLTRRSAPIAVETQFSFRGSAVERRENHDNMYITATLDVSKYVKLSTSNNTSLLVTDKKLIISIYKMASASITSTCMYTCIHWTKTIVPHVFLNTSHLVPRLVICTIPYLWLWISMQNGFV